MTESPTSIIGSTSLYRALGILLSANSHDWFTKNMTKEKKDGRLKRSERSRSAIVDAMVETIRQGVYVPSAQQVATQAGVSIRTVFRHFSEMDLLYREIDEVMRPFYLKYFTIEDDSGTVQQRAARLVESYITGYVENYHLEKAVHALLWRSSTLRESYLYNQKLLRKMLLTIIPELKDSKKPFVIEIADSVTSFEHFERLHDYQQLPVEDCKAIITRRLIELVS